MARLDRVSIRDVMGGVDESQRATRGIVSVDGVECHSLFPEQLAAYYADSTFTGARLCAAFRAASRRRLAHDLFLLLSVDGPALAAPRPRST